jgi:DNA-binding response OmpR family regulator
MKGHQLPKPPPPGKRVLVVDDAIEMRQLLNLHLQRAGFVVLTAASGQEALTLARQQGLPHLAMVDIVMPEVDGFAVADELRRLGKVPIIFLSALSDTATKVEGFRRCAEDYITKPFTWAEVLARIQRVLLRNEPDAGPSQEVTIDRHLAVNFDQHYAVLDQHRIPLTPTEGRLLHTLYTSRGQVLSPGALLARAWGTGRQGTRHALWVHLRRLRTKLEPTPSQPRYIVTVRGRGYYLPPPVNDE